MGRTRWPLGAERSVFQTHPWRMDPHLVPFSGHILCIHSSDGHLGHFHFFAIFMNKKIAVLSISMQVLVGVRFSSFEFYPGVEFWVLLLILCLAF